MAVTIVDGEINPIASLVEQYKSETAIGVFCSHSRHIGRQVSAGANARRTRFERLAQVSNGKEMAALGEGGVVFRRHIHSAIAGSACSGTTVRATLVIEHEVPYNNGLAPAHHGSNAGVLHL